MLRGLAGKIHALVELSIFSVNRVIVKPTKMSSPSFGSHLNPIKTGGEAADYADPIILLYSRNLRNIVTISAKHQILRYI